MIKEEYLKQIEELKSKTVELSWFLTKWRDNFNSLFFAGRAYEQTASLISNTESLLSDLQKDLKNKPKKLTTIFDLISLIGCGNDYVLNIQPESLQLIYTINVEDISNKENLDLNKAVKNIKKDGILFGDTVYYWSTETIGESDIMISHNKRVSVTFVKEVKY